MSETTNQPLSDDDIATTDTTTDLPAPSETDADGTDLGQDADSEDHGGGHDTDGTDADGTDSSS